MHACMYENGMDMHVEKERMKAANKDEPLGAIGLGTVFFFLPKIGWFTIWDNYRRATHVDCVNRLIITRET